MPKLISQDPISGHQIPIDVGPGEYSRDELIARHVARAKAVGDAIVADNPNLFHSGFDTEIPAIPKI